MKKLRCSECDEEYYLDSNTTIQEIGWVKRGNHFFCEECILEENGYHKADNNFDDYENFKIYYDNSLELYVKQKSHNQSIDADQKR